MWVPSWGLLSPAGGGRKALVGAGTSSRQSAAVLGVLLAGL